MPQGLLTKQLRPYFIKNFKVNNYQITSDRPEAFGLRVLGRSSFFSVQLLEFRFKLETKSSEVTFFTKYIKGIFRESEKNLRLIGSEKVSAKVHDYQNLIHWS